MTFPFFTQEMLPFAHLNEKDFPFYCILFEAKFQMTLIESIQTAWLKARQSPMIWWTILFVILIILVIGIMIRARSKTKDHDSPKQGVSETINSSNLVTHEMEKEKTVEVVPTGVWGLCLKSNARVPKWYETIDQLKRDGALFLSKASTRANLKVCGQPPAPHSGKESEQDVMPERKYYDTIQDMKMDGSYFIGWGPCRQILGPIPPSTHIPLDDNPILKYMRVYSKKGPWMLFRGLDVARVKHWIAHAYPNEDDARVISSHRLSYELTKVKGKQGDILIVTENGESSEPVLFVCRRERAAQMLNGEHGIISRLDVP